jgi:hypothetical protein
MTKAILYAVVQEPEEGEIVQVQLENGLRVMKLPSL